MRHVTYLVSVINRLPTNNKADVVWYKIAVRDWVLPVLASKGQYNIGLTVHAASLNKVSGNRATYNSVEYHFRSLYLFWHLFGHQIDQRLLICQHG